MKQFDPTSITNRFLSSLATKTEWSQIIGDSATVSLANTIGESTAEIARYCENLLSEAKWTTAMNMSSYSTLSPYLGYVPQRKVSSLGSVYISHDPNVSLVGTSVSNTLDNLSVYSSVDVSISIGFKFATILAPISEFFATEAVTYKKGLKYLEIPIMQGILSSTDVSVYGTPFEEIIITDPTVEDANNSVSKKFLSLTVTPPGVTTAIPMVQYESIFFASNLEYAYEVWGTADLSMVIRFGNGNTGMILPAGSNVHISYVTSLGSSGNVNTPYLVTGVVDTATIPMYCTNMAPVLGGGDNDTINSIRGKAPTEYLLFGGSVVSINQYKKVIESLPYVQTASVYAGEYLSPITGQITNTIKYSAIDTAGNDVVEDYPYFAVTFNGVPAVIPTLLLNVTSPLDNPIYVPPSFLHLRLNFQGSTISHNLATLQSTIKSDVYTNYGTLIQKYYTTFDTSSLTSYIVNKYTITRASLLTEAVMTLKPSTFSVDSQFPAYYTKSFQFDPSYQSFYGFDNNHPYCLKINIQFTCNQAKTIAGHYSWFLMLPVLPSIIPVYSLALYPQEPIS